MQTKPSYLVRLLSLNAEGVNAFTNKDVPGFEVYRAVVDAYEKSCADYAGATWAENVEAERLKYEGSLFEFFKRAWQEFDPSPLKVGAHHWLICRHLEAITRGEFTAQGYRKCLINVPPRHTKTALVNICWLAWTWAQRDIAPLSGPQVRFMCISYGDRLAKDIARTARRLVLSEWYQQMWGHQVRILDDQASIDNFGNTAGGSRIATSMSGATLGRGGDVKILDDPEKIEEAESEDERLRILRIYDEGLATRETDPSTSVEVCVMQRVHEGDVAGHMLSTSGSELAHICLPGKYDPERHCQSPWGEDWRTEDGELLWPEQFPQRIMDQLERRMGPYAFASQIQQSPAPRGGGIIEKEWWQVWPEVPPPLGQPVQLPDVSFVLVSLDTAISEEEQASYNACTVWGIWHRAPNAPRTQRVTDSGADMRGVFADRAGMVERAFLIPEWVGRLPQSEQEEWLRQRREKTLRYTPTNYAHDLRDEEQPRIILMEAWRRRCRLHDPTLGPDGQPKGLVERVLDTARRRHANALVIENKTRGKDVQQELQRMMRAAEFGVHLFEPRKHGDKVSRLLSVQPLFTGGLIYAPVAYDPVTGEQQEFRWCQSVISEIAQVPKGQFNDLADSSSQGLIWLREAGLILLTEEHIQEQLESRAFRPKRESVAQHYGV